MPKILDLFRDKEMEETRVPITTEDEPKLGVDVQDSIVDGYRKDKLKKAAVSGLLDSIKGKTPPNQPRLIQFLGILCRTRAETGEITETDEPREEDIGIGFSFIIEMARAKVAVNDLDDSTRHILSALYTGLQIGHKRTTSGLPLEYSATETGFGLQ